MRFKGQLAIIAIASLLSACDWSPTSPNNKLGKSSSLADGTRITLAGSTSFGVRSLNGRVVSQAIGTWQLEAAVVNGLASSAPERNHTGAAFSLNLPRDVVENRVAAAGMDGVTPLPFMSVRRGGILTNGKPGEIRLRHARGSDGKLHYFLTRFGSRGGPPIEIVHAVDHEITDVVNYHWASVDNGWVATAATTTFFSKGTIVAQLRNTVSHTDVASAAPRDAVKTPTLVAAAAGVVAAVFLPQPLRAQSGSRAPITARDDFGDCSAPEINGPCSEYLQNYLADLASFTAGALYASEAAAATGGVLTPAAALVVAALAARAALDAYQYNQCVNSNSQTANCNSSLADGNFTNGTDAVTGELASYTDESTGAGLPSWLQAVIVAAWNNCAASGADDCIYS